MCYCFWDQRRFLCSKKYQDSRNFKQNAGRPCMNQCGSMMGKQIVCTASVATELLCVWSWKFSKFAGLRRPRKIQVVSVYRVYRLYRVIVWITHMRVTHSKSPHPNSSFWNNYSSTGWPSRVNHHTYPRIPKLVLDHGFPYLTPGCSQLLTDLQCQGKATQDCVSIATPVTSC